MGERPAKRTRLQFADRRADAASSSSAPAGGGAQDVARPSCTVIARPSKEHSEQKQAKRRCNEQPDKGTEVTSASTAVEVSITDCRRILILRRDEWRMAYLSHREGAMYCAVPANCGPDCS